ncbi:MAG: phosphate transport system regulatory protein PhoU [Phycisphaeraceae bacterium]|nr:MAG: phosphate transport system regulatory protein PhoU [Phycisphaeraceae bacterium]
MTEKTQMDLMHLRRALLTMGASTESRVNRAFEALFTQNVELARNVRESDDEIDKMELDVENECIEILALDQPLANDLRFVLTSMRIGASLERIADLARTVAKGVIKVGTEPPTQYPDSLREMAKMAQSMVGDVLRALSDNDVKLAEDVHRRDDFVDQKNKEFFAWVVRTISEEEHDVRVMIRILLIGRTIERLADIAGNIAEDVIYCVRGSVVRHSEI